MQTAPLSKSLSQVPLRLGTKELRSLVQPVSNPPELRMTRHSSAGTIMKKRVCAFRKAEQSSAMQSRKGREREKGPPKLKTEQRSPKTPPQTSL